jgi:hypothetical protein
VRSQLAMKPILFSLGQLHHPQITLNLFEGDNNAVGGNAENRLPGIMLGVPVKMLHWERIAGDRFSSRQIHPYGPEARKPVPIRGEIDRLAVR